MRQIFIILHLFVWFIVNSQDASNDNFKKLLQDKKFKKEYQKADRFLLDKNYYAALDIYRKWDSIYPGIPNLNYKIGYCYLQMIGTEIRRKAIPYLEKAFTGVAKEYVGDYKEYYAPIETYLYLGVAYTLRYQFPKAFEMYDRYIKNIENDADLSSRVDSVKFLKQKCYNAIKLINNPVSIKIENLVSLNSPYPEYSPIVTQDEKTIYFTSRRPGSTGNKKDPTGRYYEDIYYSTKNVKGEWESPRHIGGKINSKYHEATISLANDGKTMLTYKSEKSNGDIYISHMDEKGEWSKPEKLPYPINTTNWETHACFSSDGKKLYFVSDRPGGFGRRDIWVTEYVNGQWSEPDNLGPTINTPYDEDSPFLLPDDRTLYFFSQGHDNMGGFDIFVSVLSDDGYWSIPENIGYPINTTDDDIFYVPTKDELHAYYASAKSYGLGDLDLYYMTIVHPKRKLIKLQGRVADDRTYKNLKADITFYYALDSSTILTSTTSSAETGEYKTTLLLGKDYKIIVKAEGYQPAEYSLSINENDSRSILTQDFYLKKLFQLGDTQKVTAEDFHIGDKFVLRNIYYDFDSYKLRRESIDELNRLVKLLKDVPSLKIEISSHTDSIGGYKYNMELSQKRAESVVNYLVAAGISKDRLIAKGYGYTMPIASNKTDEGRQLNRRTEFRIIAK